MELLSLAQTVEPRFGLACPTEADGVAIQPSGEEEEGGQGTRVAEEVEEMGSVVETRSGENHDMYKYYKYSYTIRTLSTWYIVRTCTLRPFIKRQRNHPTAGHAHHCERKKGKRTKKARNEATIISVVLPVQPHAHVGHADEGRHARVYLCSEGDKHWGNRGLSLARLGRTGGKNEYPRVSNTIMMLGGWFGTQFPFGSRSARWQVGCSCEVHQLGQARDALDPWRRYRGAESCDKGWRKNAWRTVVRIDQSTKQC